MPKKVKSAVVYDPLGNPGQMCRPFAVLRDKQDRETSLARDLRQQTVHPRLLESTLERKDYDLG